MFARLQGLTILINTYLPVIIIGLFYLVYAIYAPAVQTGWQETRASLNTIIAQADVALKVIVEVKEKTQEEIDKSLEKFQDIRDNVKDLYETTKAPIDKIAQLKIKYVNGLQFNENIVNILGKKVNIPTPSLTKANYKFGANIAAPFTKILGSFDKLIAPLDDLEKAFEELEKLKQLQLGMALYQAELAKLAGQLKAFGDAITQLFNIIFYLCLAAMLWITWIWCLAVQGRTSKGLALLRGTAISA